MSHNSFGHLFRVTTWGESHGPAIGGVVDGCPPGIALAEADLQPWLDRRRPGQNRFVSQRREPDAVRILSGVFEGVTTGAPISLIIDNVDAPDDYDAIPAARPQPLRLEARTACAPLGGGRASPAKPVRVAAGGVPQVPVRSASAPRCPGRPHAVSRDRFDWTSGRQPPFCPDPRWSRLGGPHDTCAGPVPHGAVFLGGRVGGPAAGARRCTESSTRRSTPRDVIMRSRGGMGRLRRGRRCGRRHATRCGGSRRAGSCQTTPRRAAASPRPPIVARMR